MTCNRCGGSLRQTGEGPLPHTVTDCIRHMVQRVEALEQPKPQRGTLLPLMPVTDCIRHLAQRIEALERPRRGTLTGLLSGRPDPRPMVARLRARLELWSSCSCLREKPSGSPYWYAHAGDCQWRDVSDLVGLVEDILRAQEREGNH